MLACRQTAHMNGVIDFCASCGVFPSFGAVRLQLATVGESGSVLDEERVCEAPKEDQTAFPQAC
jgi:hypothetical protein